MISTACPCAMRPIWHRSPRKCSAGVRAFRSPHEAQRNAGAAAPDYAALHPGYEGPLWDNSPDPHRNERPMTQSASLLILQFLSWVADRPRTRRFSARARPPPAPTAHPVAGLGLRVGRAVWLNARKLGSAPGKSRLTRADGTRNAPRSSRGGKNLLSAGYGRTGDLLAFTLESQTDSAQSKGVFWRIESPQALVFTSKDFKVTSKIRGFSRLNRRAAAASRVLRPPGHDSSTCIPSRMVTPRSMR